MYWPTIGEEADGTWWDMVEAASIARVTHDGRAEDNSDTMPGTIQPDMFAPEQLQFAF